MVNFGMEKVFIKDKGILEKSVIVLLNALLFLVLFAPTVMQVEKIILMGILLLFLVVQVTTSRKMYIRPMILLWVWLYVTMDLFFLAEGVANNFNIFMELAPTYIFWPILYTLVLIIPVSYLKYTFQSTGIFVFSAFVIVIYILYIYLYFRGYAPKTFIIALPLGYSINYNFGYINFFTPSISSLIFLIPYVISMLMNRKDFRKYNLIYLLLVLLLGIFIVFIVGRRALIFVVIVAPIISIAWSLVASMNKKITSQVFIFFLFLLIIIAGYFLIANYSTVGLRIQNYTHLDKGIRYDEFLSLIHGWEQHPFLGSGLGVNASVVRSSVSGSYELTYIAQLFQTGLIGVGLYMSLVLWIFYKLIKIARSNKACAAHIVALLTGMTCMFIANSTNPYIGNFDGLWIIFYPLALINLHKKGT